ncbi:hypothetical protein DYU05_14660 [Mucilaginibacter terrenus]|uniref:Uncharacterized protein n=1 Tax=Mucilaginibacter terrenus TaxID=2482727 RepID=A0A3E2NQV3_9SPHI|nr:hypothetical protein [Mucilaginibacter terrenus]RFZ83374.1 hypothetical protein DYU05_14660 [Mucilaginibacter terrenus]
MEETAIKADLLDKIEHADGEQLQQIYGMVLNYFNAVVPSEEWITMPEAMQSRIIESLEQADAGLMRPADNVLKEIRKKYDLNG